MSLDVALLNLGSASLCSCFTYVTLVGLLDAAVGVLGLAGDRKATGRVGREQRRQVRDILDGLIVVSNQKVTPSHTGLKAPCAPRALLVQYIKAWRMVGSVESNFRTGEMQPWLYIRDVDE